MLILNLILLALSITVGYFLGAAMEHLYNTSFKDIYYYRSRLIMYSVLLLILFIIFFYINC